MHMRHHGSFAQAWQSCFSHQSPDDLGQQVLEMSTLVGYGLRGPGMVHDPEELYNLDDGDYSVIVYYPAGDGYFVPVVIRSVMLGMQGSLSNTTVALLNGSAPSAVAPPEDEEVPTLEDLRTKGFWPLYRAD